MTVRRILALLLGVSLLLPAAAAADASEGWPREIQLPFGLVVVYQPQVDDLEGNRLSARAAVSVTLTGDETPVFGAIWIESTIATDRDARTATIGDVKVTRTRFGDATPEQEEKLARDLTAELPDWSLELSLDRLLASLATAERQRDSSSGFDDSPPKILFAEVPTILVTIDGEPKFLALENSPLQYVANTPFVIIKAERSQFWLYAGDDTWYSASAVAGPWTPSTNVPDSIAQLAPDEDEPEEEPGQQTGPADHTEADTSGPPQIIVAAEPTELIVTSGRPVYTPLGAGDLLHVSNTTSDIVVDIESQRHFVLLSGRWFAAASLAGPWSFVAGDSLPASFSAIPPESEMGHVLTWVAGTDQANEAILDAAVPQTSAVQRDATIEVTYDGEPKFEPIEQTKIRYAVNTSSQVIKVGTSYYCVHEAVWYTAPSPTGPWSVATSVPDEIQEIPPSSPMYNIRYVHVYEVRQEVVYVGYHPGYTHSFVHHGCVVWGTGFWYRPWWGSVYYPRHHTWGFHVRWNPWYGWRFGFSWSSGRFAFGIGFGGRYRAGWWGPVGHRPYRRGYHRGWSSGYRAGRRHQARQNIYHRPQNRPRNAQARATTRSPQMSPSRSNNVYADRQGNVHRRTSDGSWQSRENRDWSKTARSSSGARSSTSNRNQSLDRAHQSRQRGTQRTQSYRSSTRSSGGARRSGGGRRR